MVPEAFGAAAMGIAVINIKESHHI